MFNVEAQQTWLHIYGQFTINGCLKLRGKYVCILKSRNESIAPSYWSIGIAYWWAPQKTVGDWRPMLWSETLLLTRKYIVEQPRGPIHEEEKLQRWMGINNAALNKLVKENLSWERQPFVSSNNYRTQFQYRFDRPLLVNNAFFNRLA